METPCNNRNLSIHRALDLGKLAQYNKLMPKVSMARNRYYKIHAQVLKIANDYYAALPEVDVVIRLRREIRMATKGTPETIAVDSITTAGYVSFGTEQLYNAQAHLVKKAYRLVRSLVHPDLGGDAELFRLVNAAYHLRDLTFLQELYIQLVKDSLWYRASDEGLAYLKQEIERPVVSLRILQSTPEFTIAQRHLSGNIESADRCARARLAELIGTLNNELNYLLTKHITINTHGVSNAQEESNDQESRHRHRSALEEDGSQEDYGESGSPR
jgi:hypothetical protein